MGTYVLSVKYAISEMASKTFILLKVVCKSTSSGSFCTTFKTESEF